MFCVLCLLRQESQSQMATETSTAVKKNVEKVPKRIHKSKREKMKREHLNELFLALENSLELSDQNTGRASMLIEATRLVKDTLAQIKCLKEENDALLSESKYVTEEKNELKDENSALEAEIGRLRAEIKSRLPETQQLDLNIAPSENQNQELFTCGTESPFMFQQIPGLHQGHIVNPLLVYSAYGAEHRSSGCPVVSKPHARYPMPLSAWPPLRLLEKPPELGDGDRSNSNCAEARTQH